MIKIISFDLDGTLIKSTFADLVWLEGLPKIYSQEKGICFKKAKEFIIKEYDKIGNYRREWYDLEYWFNRFNLKYSWKDILEEYRDSIETYPEVLDVLIKLNKKFDLIVSSNAKIEFIQIELEESNLFEFFTYVFSSTSDFNKVKKIADFYSMVCEKIGVNPDEMIHIGDHKEFDFLIPRQIGIKSFYLDRKKTSKEKFSVYDLQDFVKQVNKI